MIFGNLKIFVLASIVFFLNFYSVFAEDKIESVPLINLQDLSPTFDEDKEQLESKKFFGPLEINALKCQISETNETSDTVAYLQVKDLSIKDNNQVFLFNGWTFASSPTLQSIDHPVYDLWITSCENI